MGGRKGTNFKALFIIGIVFLIVGLTFVTRRSDIPGALIVIGGIIMIVIGRNKKSKWK